MIILDITNIFTKVHKYQYFSCITLINNNNSFITAWLRTTDSFYEPKKHHKYEIYK